MHEFKKNLCLSPILMKLKIWLRGNMKSYIVQVMSNLWGNIKWLFWGSISLISKWTIPHGYEGGWIHRKKIIVGPGVVWRSIIKEIFELNLEGKTWKIESVLKSERVKTERWRSTWCAPGNSLSETKI